MADDKADSGDAAPAATSDSGHGTKRLNSAHSGMESSVFRFKDVNFTVGKAEKQKYLLTDVNETVKWGRVLASEYMVELSFLRKVTRSFSQIFLAFAPFLAVVKSHGTLR